MVNTNDLTRLQATSSGAQSRPIIPHLQSTPPSDHPLPRSLEEFRIQEGPAERKRRWLQVWNRLPNSPDHGHGTPGVPVPISDLRGLTPETAMKLKGMYDNELWGRCGGNTYRSSAHPVGWKAFKAYAEAKEVELWSIFHDQLDLDGNGRLDSDELSFALAKAGINLEPATLSEFMTSLTSSTHARPITFSEFRDFFLLLPRQLSTAEIYRYYAVRKFMGDDGRGAGRVTSEGDVTLSAEDKPQSSSSRQSVSPATVEDRLEPFEPGDAEDDDSCYEEEDGHHNTLDGRTALKFLSAGGIAGAVSRTTTAPLDRLKVFLITRIPDSGGTSAAPKPGMGGFSAMSGAVARIYTEGGLLAFWTGNGLSVAKILPESAIKFFTYESSKRAFAKYWDKVEDPKDISGISRFLSGGVGGISSQLSIYPIETLKTQMMSDSDKQKRTLVSAVRHVWALGGFKAFYRGLAIGLMGVFPYSAIDMSTFEALKLAYLRSTGKDEPGVLAVLAFGSISGSVGATSVYPFNLVRTRLQASGSSGHPQRYTGVWDVVVKTYERDGWRGFYRGLFPTLAKVVPAVSISYVVYEHSKRKLGV